MNGGGLVVIDTGLHHLSNQHTQPLQPLNLASYEGSTLEHGFDLGKL